MDDLTLGEMLTAAHRRQVDYCVPEGVSVSQSSSSVEFDGSGQPDGERMVDQSGKSGVTFNVISAHSNFSGTGKNPGGILLMSITTKTYPVLIDPGKPDEK